jgi:glycosyltransferase involved in cell wall biosynthesis
MRIAVFHEVPKGGARRAVNMYALHLKKNHTVDLFTSETIDSFEKKNFTNVYTYPFSATAWKGGNFRKRLHIDSIELLGLAMLHKKIAKKINENDYDIAFVNPSRYIQSPFILRYLKIPKVFYLHDPHYRILYEKEFALPLSIGVGRYIYEKINRKIRKILDRNNLLAADMIAANSFYTKKIAKKSYGINSLVCYLGVDHRYFFKGTKKKDIDIVYIGSSLGVDDFPLVKKTLEGIEKKVHVRLVLTDKQWYKDAEMRELYQRSKITLCCTKNEPFGLVPLEAMACGSIVIAINEGGYKETILDGKTGFLAERNSVSVSKKIKLCLQNEVRRRKMEAMAREYIVQQWTWEKATKRLELLLLKTIKRK